MPLPAKIPIQLKLPYTNTLGLRQAVDKTQICLEHNVIMIGCAHRIMIRDAVCNGHAIARVGEFR
jgi:hypothetical protein